MVEKLSDKELVSFKELLMANCIQVDALAQLLIDPNMSPENLSYPHRPGEASASEPKRTLQPVAQILDRRLYNKPPLEDEAFKERRFKA